MCVCLWVCGREEWWRMKMGDGEATGKFETGNSYGRIFLSKGCNIRGKEVWLEEESQGRSV